jgi:hypothetical protein
LLRSALFFGAVFMNGVAACAAGLPLGSGVGPDILPVPDLKAGIIVGTGPASLLPFGVPDCPTGAGCPGQPILRPYLVPGNLVAVTVTIPGYVYVTYPTPKHSYEGWVPSDRVSLPPKGIATSLSTWAGKWNGDPFDDARINITISGGVVHVDGEAVNPRDDSEADIKGNAVPRGNFIVVNDNEFHPDSCVAKMVVLNGVLAVKDSPNCHGADASLSGVYTRAAS